MKRPMQAGRRWAIVASMATALGTAGCAGTSAPPLPASLATGEASVYRLGLGDKLRVNVFGERDLSGEFQVSGNGSIDMPLIGSVKAVGLSARELQEALTRRLSDGYLVNPQVAVEVYDFRPFYVLGEVQNPGKFPAGEGTTLLGAIATAGGFSYRADQSRLFIRRAGDATEYQVDPKQELIVRPGDVIRVGERHF